SPPLNDRNPFDDVLRLPVKVSARMAPLVVGRAAGEVRVHGPVSDFLERDAKHVSRDSVVSDEQVTYVEACPLQRVQPVLGKECLVHGEVLQLPCEPWLLVALDLEAPGED